jgi:hypothetical protein
MLRLLGRRPQRWATLQTHASPPRLLIHVRSFANNVGDNGSGNSNNDGKTPNNKKAVSVIVPTKLGFGDEAPRMPHVLALPVISRPLFPGVVTSVILTEPATIDALANLQKNGQNSYISVFLRKRYPTGVLLTRPIFILWVLLPKFIA